MKTLFILSLLAFDSNLVLSQQFSKPLFPGGEDALYTFIKDELVYPIEARELGLEGSVVIRLYIDEGGKVYQIKFLSCEVPCFERAIRKLIAHMPNWTPARSGDKRVKAAVNLSIRFQLES